MQFDNKLRKKYRDRSICLTRKGSLRLAFQRTILEYQNPVHLSEEERAEIAIIDSIRKYM